MNLPHTLQKTEKEGDFIFYITFKLCLVFLVMFSHFLPLKKKTNQVWKIFFFYCYFLDIVQIDFWKFWVSPFTCYSCKLYLSLSNSYLLKALLGFSFALLTSFGVVMPLEPSFTEISLFGIHILEIVIYLEIKYILNLHVQFQKFFSPIIFSKQLP